MNFDQHLQECLNDPSLGFGDFLKRVLDFRPRPTMDDEQLTHLSQLYMAKAFERCWREQETQNWWWQQDQDDTWIEEQSHAN